MKKQTKLTHIGSAERNKNQYTGDIEELLHKYGIDCM